MSSKPLPQSTAISAEFWQALKSERLIAIECNSCGKLTFYPRRHCQHCLSHDVQFKDIAHTGSLYSFTVARIPTLPEFADESPQILAVVELEGGVRMNTTLVGVAVDEVKIGMPVTALFDEVNARGDTLVRFTPASAAIGSKCAFVNPLDALETNAQGQKIVPLSNLAALNALVSDEFSEWSNTYTITQDVINQFAALSGDDYWIHTDPVRSATDSPYKTTIAHGALVQILQSKLRFALPYEITGFNTMVNYGSNKLRFPAPVPVDSDIHARARVKSIDIGPKGVQLILEVHTHVVGQDRPSVINELVIFYR